MEPEIEELVRMHVKRVLNEHYANVLKHREEVKEADALVEVMQAELKRVQEYQQELINESYGQCWCPEYRLKVKQTEELLKISTDEHTESVAKATVARERAEHVMFHLD